jgi:hypothetical protein
MTPAPTQPPLPPPPAAPEPVARPPEKERRRMTTQAIAISILAHIIFILSAAFLTVIVIQGRQKVMFEGKKNPSIPARKLEHSIRVKQMQKQVRKPQILQRLVTEAPSKVALPQLQDMKTPDIKSMRDTPMLGARAGQLGGLTGAGGGAGRGLTGGTGYSDTKFFGDNVRTRAIIVLVDVTTTIFKIGAIDALKREAEIMLSGLSPGTKFNLIVYVDGAGAYQPEMVFALEEHKKGAINFLNSLIENDKRGNHPGTGGTSPKMALELAAEMGPDTIYIITDADYPKIQITRPGQVDMAAVSTGKPSSYEPAPRPGEPPYVPGHADAIIEFVKSIPSRYGRAPRINPIVFYPSRDPEWPYTKEFYRKIATLTGGRLKTIE